MNTDQSDALQHARQSGFRILTSKLAKVTFALKTDSVSGRVRLKAWRGGAAAPAWDWTFKNAANAETYAADFVRTVQKVETEKARRAEEKKAARQALRASDHWAVGDVVYTSWGYDQTNVEYFQITQLKNRSVVVRQVCTNNSNHGQPGGGKVAPRRFEFTGPEIMCPLDERGRFNAGPCHNRNKPSYRHPCYKWDGKPQYTSSDH